MKRTIKSNRIAKLTIGITASALIALPLLAPSTQTAEAQLGRVLRNRQNVDRGTMLATVTRDLGGNRFEVRADDNRLFTVRQPGGEPRRLSVGDRVELTGYISNNNVFVAESTRIISNSTSSSSTARGTMIATVTRDLGGNRFEVRADDNRVFTVRSPQGEPRRLSVGDRVELTGYINNDNVFVAENVRILSNNRSNNRYNNRNNNRNNRYGNRRSTYGTRNGQRVDFTATVLRMNGNYVEVRGDNGQTYNVRRNNRSTFRRGERVRIVGIYSNSTVQASSINRL